MVKIKVHTVGTGLVLFQLSQGTESVAYVVPRETAAKISEAFATASVRRNFATEVVAIADMEKNQ
jgi:hypothetical protein